MFNVSNNRLHDDAITIWHWLNESPPTCMKLAVSNNSGLVARMTVNVTKAQYVCSNITANCNLWYSVNLTSCAYSASFYSDTLRITPVCDKCVLRAVDWT
jgi:hypothetical protein